MSRYNSIRHNILKTEGILQFLPAELVVLNKVGFGSAVKPRTITGGVGLLDGN
jgi:hypothetical protein